MIRAGAAVLRRATGTGRCTNGRRGRLATSGHGPSALAPSMLQQPADAATLQTRRRADSAASIHICLRARPACERPARDLPATSAPAPPSPALRFRPALHPEPRHPTTHTVHHRTNARRRSLSTPPPPSSASASATPPALRRPPLHRSASPPRCRLLPRPLPLPPASADLAHRTPRPCQTLPRRPPP